MRKLMRECGVSPATSSMYLVSHVPENQSRKTHRPKVCMIMYGMYGTYGIVRYRIVPYDMYDTIPTIP